MSFAPNDSFFSSANSQWVELIHDILGSGKVVKPRGKETKEILCYQTQIDMKRPVVTYHSRKLGYRFLFAEAAWILSGDNKVATIKPYSKQIANFSDDGVFFHGAYGPKILDQLTYVVDCLSNDPDTRQAVINIWRENPRPTKDVPCTISVQFFVRNGMLHCVDTMRSSDAWLGWPYDVFNFSMLSAFVLLLLRERGIRYELGSLTLTAGSQHLYEPHWEAANNIYASSPKFAYRSLDVEDFVSPGHLIEHLWTMANRDENTKPGDLQSRWLTELL